MTAQRQILHVDMDAFYASVEQRDNAMLRGAPLVVGGGSNRGVVAAASYEARRYGIHSAMPMREALRRCPDLVRVAPRMTHYQAVSQEVFRIFHAVTPLVEGLSLDEAFLDVTGSIALYGPAASIAARIKHDIRQRTGLTASVGVAPNKLVAKIASDLDKPDGLVIVRPDELQAVLDPLPVQVIPGIGRETLARLAPFGIRTIRDLRRADDRALAAVFGRFAARTRDRARGVDERPVAGERAASSISAEETFDRDLREDGSLRHALLRLAERCAARLRKEDLYAGTLVLKVRQSDFTTATRQCALHPPANGTDVLYARARQLLAIWQREHPGAAIRLLGVGGADLAGAGQGDLFADGPRDGGAVLDRTVDAIRDRFGKLAAVRARTLNKDQFR
ncbi:MAG TPA: DNA polymerase IV [Woeseiaceae bacterium]|nr:DNA polymerase IV [Woeseiaceae bacterium]